MGGAGASAMEAPPKQIMFAAGSPQDEFSDGLVRGGLEVTGGSGVEVLAAEALAHI